MKDPETLQGTGKPLEPEDPFALVMHPVAGGDLKRMTTCLIEEFARLGMGEEAILQLFRSPVYQTHALYKKYGEEAIRDLIRKVADKTGRMRISVQIPEPEEDHDESI